MIRAVAVLFFVAALGGEAAAQCPGGPFNAAGPNCSPVPAYTSNSHVAGQAVLLDSGGRTMQHLGALMSNRNAASAGNNPQGGGAEPEMPQRYRAWFEGYGLRSRADAQGDFAGDRRTTAGGVAGFGVTVAPGFNVGLSVDQSHTHVKIDDAVQSGRIDLTQIAAIAAYETGPWNIGATLIRGFGNVRTSRTDAAGQSVADYNARLWGAMIEVGYYHELPNNSRLLPKLSFDWTRARSDAFLETGSAPVSGSATTSSRTRMLIGAELGHTWLMQRTIMDFSVYGRFVDNLSQKFGQFQISDPSGGTIPRLVGGFFESRTGADAGAALTAKLSEAVRLYALYDGRYRGNFVSHTGTVGAEFRW
jgi:uncharacterized protein with beta-barrel porin domain